MKHTISILVLIVFSISGFSQSQDQNYFKTTTYINEGNDSIETIQYFDGLGRPVQTLQKGITPQKFDLATFTEYDGVGREWKNHLPVIGSGNGTYVPLSSFSSSPIYNGDNRTFAETIYEPSPLNRVAAQKGPGEAWNSHPVSTDYQTNASGEVKLFTVSGAGQLINSGTYPPATLYKTVTKDEDNKSVIEYTDKLGRMIMRRHGTNADTYYVYNDLGQLAYLLPPLAADAGGSEDAVNKFGYVYQYDGRGNCRYKKLPGCEPIYMVYDKADRLIASQDGNQRKKNQWTINKYDILGRIIYTALLVRPVSLEQMENTLHPLLIIEHYDEASSFSNTGYTCDYFTNELTPILVNYYDDYRFLQTLPSSGIDTTKIRYTSKQGYSEKYTSAKGLLTGTRTYELSNPSKFTVSALYYDNKGNVIQSRSTNHLGGYDIVYYDLDFTGKPNKTLKEHSRNQNHTGTTNELYTYAYDHAGRLTQTRYKLNNNDEVILSDNTYDELGRLARKGRHNGADNEEYAYNIRNQPTKIKSGDFEEKLYYNTELPQNAAPCYNGNISAQTWTYNGLLNGYRFTYDELNRLTYSYGNRDGVSSYNENFRYDKHGNMTSLYRYGGILSGHASPVLLDFLYFQNYDGNKITGIYDYAGSRNLPDVKEYQAIHNGYGGSTGAIDMTYDDNGNLISDLDRDIGAIRYNLLNLPDTVQFKNGHMIINKYDASGKKLMKTIVTSRSTVIVPVNTTLKPNFYDFYWSGTAYCGNIEYSVAYSHYGNTYYPSKSYNTEGYTTLMGTAVFNYFRRDHLGSIREIWRASYMQGSTNYPAATINRTQYYASGLPWDEGMNIQPRYNGKEWIEAHGLDEYDYGARGYYPAIMRFSTVDPLAELKPWLSTYAYCSNNPINRIDPDGRFDIEKETQKKYPQLTDYIKGLSNDWNNKEQRFKDNFMEKSGLTEKQVNDMLEFGKGPKLEVKDLTKEKANGTTLVFLDTRTGKETNALDGKGLITLSTKIVDMMEKAVTNEEKGVALLMVESTVFHEGTHFGNAKVHGNSDANGKFGKDPGKSFEKDAYGRDIDPSNVKRVWRALQPVQIIPTPKTPLLKIIP